MWNAFRQGRAAKVAGHPIDANPYQPHTDAYNEWRDGWLSNQ